ncbi:MULTISPECIES: DUF6889 family protein [Cupriavidus]|uniref:Uncharacterized protein n=1 Tax=Cupriavidus alkaliphilus TaxID=942866 RepID=A0A7W4YQ43_9BURK|nr:MULTISPECIES: hypothetical protein [Cupriavidus]MBB3006042.1 hypothetical protein [Cupriavidus alkaliphilus]SCB10302.1 hypothetical protein GA0116996_101654 [Cupriavidus alkaliphilus]SPA44836.1 conserved hypothetical protein [Cupriavidus taiwanensis]
MAEGWCKYESLLDGSLGLEDIALMNDAITVRGDNLAAARRMLEEKNGR